MIRLLRAVSYFYLVLCAISGAADPVEQLQKEIEQIIRSVDAEVHVGIEVVSLNTKETLYSRHANHFFVPASTLKLITGAAALSVLGGDFRFETGVFADGPIRHHCLKGNLYIKGSGDPELSLEALESLVAQLQAQQLQVIEKDLCVDHSAFDEISQGPGWMWDEGANYWNAPMGALTLHHSCVDVSVLPPRSPSQRPSVTIFPQTNYVVMQNFAVTAEGELSVERKWRTGENVIEIRGALPLGAEEKEFSVSVEAPHLFAATVFREMLQRKGITVKGKIIARELPQRAVKLATSFSPPLSEIVAKMMKESDNLIADCLFKKVGQVAWGEQGTWQRGSSAVKEFLAKVPLDVSRLAIVDGGGISRYNLLSPHQLVQLLLWVEGQSAMASSFKSALAVLGVDEKVKQRIPAAGGSVRAKTGGMTGISSLAGYVTTKNGEELAFAIMANNLISPIGEFRSSIEDQICMVLVDLLRN